MYNKLEMYKCLVLSTAHITYQDMLTLDRMAEDNTLVMVSKYGYFIKLHNGFLNNYSGELSDTLKHVLSFCINYDCMLLELDRDAVEIDSLPSYDW